MSTVRANAILDASGGNTATINSMTPTADSLQGFRNRIINGDMGIAQRSSGSVSNTFALNSLVYDTVDRWGYWAAGANKFTVSQSSTAPPGFSNSALITSSTALSVVSSDYYTFSQRIEGFNFSDFGFGTANAKSFTVSFWVRSSITGTFPFYCLNSGLARSYVSTFAINSANTWEQKTITVAGDTTGTWVGATNGIGIEVGFTLACGSTYFHPSANTWSSSFYALGLSGATNFLSTNGATLNITGVQLEVGSVATPFERIDYGRELLLCYRYFQKLNSPTAYGYPGNAYFSATGPTNAYGTLVFIIPMRAAPTLSATGNLRLVDQTQGSPTISALTGDAARTSTYSTEVQATVSSGLVQYRTYWLHNSNDTTASVNLAAEL